MNLLLCIGCNAYDHLPPLQGAEKDAKDVFGFLSQPGDYDKNFSRLLLSPCQLEIEKALHEMFPARSEIGVLTFFFAGHAGVKAGSFYLCPRNAEWERLSMTAFQITTLFSITNEVQPRQVNIVVDACQAGGSSFDLAQLLKQEVVGHSKSSSIIFMGACSSNESAGETPDGGILTRYLIKCLTGERQIQTKSPSLDLIDISTTVCQDVHRDHPRQKPIWWGLSLFGNGYFSRNPHFNSSEAEPSFPVESVLPQSEIGNRIRLNSSAIWDEYRTIKEDPNPRRLLDLLNLVFPEENRDLRGAITCIQGLAHTLSAGAGESSESLAASQCLATCAVSLLPHIDSELVKAYTADVFREIMALDLPVWNRLLTATKPEEQSLLSNVGIVADLYYLPLRITKILGWLGLSILVESLIPDLIDGQDGVRFSLASALVERYTKSIVAVSDEQAASLYVFCTACLLKGQTQLAEYLINCYFASFAEKRGKVTMVGSDGIQAFRYIQSLGPAEYRPNNWRPANPSHLLPGRLLFGVKLGLTGIWDLRPLDRIHSAFFIPADYRDFARKVMSQGMNYTQQMGFSIWSLSTFGKEFERAITQSFSSDTRNFCKEGVALCSTASLLFPDRIPLLLECALC